jgi:hypothetical protein
MKRIGKAASVFAILLLLTTQLAAQEARDLGDAAVTNRLAYIQNSLDGGQKAADLWWYGWLVGYGAATAGQLAVYSRSDDEKQRQDMLVGAVTTALGAGGVLIFPVEAGGFAARLRAMPGDTLEARRVKLASAEGYLRKAAAQEELGRSFQTQAIATAVNLAAGLTIWLHYNRPAKDGLITFAIGQIISEVQIFSQPMRAVRDLREYQQRTDFDHVSASGAGHRTWYVSVAPAGFVVGCRF